MAHGGSGRKPNSRGVRVQLRRLMTMFDGACWWCGVPVLEYIQRAGEPADERLPTKATRDHVHPRSQGGREAFDNLVLACHRCNQERGCLGQAAWRRRLRESGRPARLHSEFRALRARWVTAEPEWFREYVARHAARHAARQRRERVRSPTPRGPQQPAGPDLGSARGSSS